MTKPAGGAARWPIVLASAAVVVMVATAMLTRIRQRRVEHQAPPANSAGPAVTLSETRKILGTFVTMTVVASDERLAGQHIHAAFDRIAELDRVLSTYRSDSEMAAVNSGAAHRPVAVSDDLFAAIRSGVEWHGHSRGAFDVAVGPLLDLWRTCGKADRVPSQDELSRVRRVLGADRIELDEAARTVRFPVDGMRVDLGGLGKGYCADEVHDLLESRGVTSALIAAAGDIRALGKRADGGPWRIGIQDPRNPDSSEALLAVVELAGLSVSTSGNYRRFVTIRGRRYSHIKDPRTGLCADHVPSVTVIGPDTVTTDVLGTALSVLGVEEGMAWVEQMPEIEALFITFAEQDAPQFARSSGFGKYESAVTGKPDYRK